MINVEIINFFFALRVATEMFYQSKEPKVTKLIMKKQLSSAFDY